jgi:hypothetical protein
MLDVFLKFGSVGSFGWSERKRLRRRFAMEDGS